MKTRQLFFGLFILFGLTLNYSCTEDGGLGGGIDNELDVPASMALDLINGSLLDGVTTDAGNSFQISVSVTPGTTPLDILRIEEDGVTLPADRILQDGAPISGNPKLLLGTDKDGINFTLDITTSAEEKMSTYTVIVEDESDLIVSQGFVVNTMLVDPMIAINGDPNLVVPPGSIVELNLTATPGSAPLSFITVGSEGGVFVDPTNLFYGEINAAFDDNPYRLPEEDKNGFNKSIFLRVHDAGAQSYNVVIIDENERGHLVEFTIEVGEPTTDIWGVLFNQAGPEGTGGLDLDEGFGTGSTSTLAEIKDEGIDVNQPRAENWKRRISGVNGSVVRSLVPGMNGLSETYDFMNSFLRHELVALYDAGADFTFTNADNELASPTVNQGDSFIVKNGENYYLIFIREVNETLEDNDDNYVIDIKQ